MLCSLKEGSELTDCKSIGVCFGAFKHGTAFNISLNIDDNTAIFPCI